METKEKIIKEFNYRLLETKKWNDIYINNDSLLIIHRPTGVIKIKPKYLPQ